MKMRPLFFLVLLLVIGCERPDPFQKMEEAYAKESAEAAEKDLQEWEAAQPLLRAVKMDATQRSETGAVIIKVTNKGELPFWGIKFRYTAQDPAREFPYEVEEGLAFIEGGVEPGETKTLKCGFKPQTTYPTRVTPRWDLIALVRDQANQFSFIVDGTMKEEDREAALARRK